MDRWPGTVRRAAAGVCAALLAAVLLATGPAAAAGFAEGLAAYDAGDLRGAYAAWLPLAEAGDSQAQVALAGLLESGGPGLARDPAAAVAWYRRAAASGDPIAQMNLGERHARGLGVPRDTIRALAWFMLAAEQGQAWAAGRRDALAAGLTPAQRAQAAALADSLRPPR